MIKKITYIFKKLHLFKNVMVVDKSQEAYEFWMQLTANSLILYEKDDDKILKYLTKVDFILIGSEVYERNVQNSLSRALRNLEGISLVPESFNYKIHEIGIRAIFGNEMSPRKGHYPIGE